MHGLQVDYLPDASATCRGCNFLWTEILQMVRDWVAGMALQSCGAIKIGFVESCGGRTRRRGKMVVMAARFFFVCVWWGWKAKGEAIEMVGGCVDGSGRMVVSLTAVGWAVSMVMVASGHPIRPLVGLQENLNTSSGLVGLEKRHQNMTNLYPTFRRMQHSKGTITVKSHPSENSQFYFNKVIDGGLCPFFQFSRDRNGIATDRLVGFQELGGKDDFTTKTLEALLIRKGIINGIKGDGEDEDDHENKRRTVRSSVEINSDSD
ncbi:hypothetical protein Acr_29g0005460 [Actinidia rufa]|uniref:Uncharacterized protein n=1 Tax=Actinidia rufa TaxID=165716 RepID=A0A7J0HF95_9ERIC|nr:hypothetical protein Acr_29g0005460 [Actinidia rufa]